MQAAPSIQKLLDELERLPGVGPKSAQRMAYWILNTDAAEALRALCAQTVPETALALLDALTARQAAALEEAGTALQATEAQLDTVQQQLGAAAQAQRLAQQLAARQAELAAAKPALDAARAEAGRHAGDAAQLDALTAQVTQAQSALAAYDALDTLCRQQTEARDAARLAAAQAALKFPQQDK